MLIFTTSRGPFSVITRFMRVIHQHGLVHMDYTDQPCNDDNWGVALYAPSLRGGTADVAIQ